jgi:hypothetical protein
VADLCSAVDATRTAITCHMEREEADVLPLLQERLCASQQRDMVWRTLCAMPLRLLERVLPWLAGARFAFPVFAASWIWRYSPFLGCQRLHSDRGVQCCSLEFRECYRCIPRPTKAKRQRRQDPYIPWTFQVVGVFRVHTIAPLRYDYIPEACHALARIISCHLTQAHAFLCL